MNVYLGGGNTFRELDPDRIASLAMTVAEILVGLWLLLGAKGVAAMIFKIRTAGVSKS